MNRSSFTPLGLIAALVVLVADQFSKWWVLNVLDLPDLRQIVLLPVLNLTMVMNPGVTFGLLTGLGAWGHIILIAVAMAVVIALGFWLRRAESRTMAVAIGAIAGGAVGNVIDRIRFGRVIDFIHFHIGTPWGDVSWYVFNLADAAIVCGVAVLVLEVSSVEAERGERIDLMARCERIRGHRSLGNRSAIACLSTLALGALSLDPELQSL